MSSVVRLKFKSYRPVLLLMILTVIGLFAPSHGHAADLCQLAFERSESLQLNYFRNLILKFGKHTGISYSALKQKVAEQPGVSSYRKVKLGFSEVVVYRGQDKSQAEALEYLRKFFSGEAIGDKKLVEQLLENVARSNYLFFSFSKKGADFFARQAPDRITTAYQFKSQQFLKNAPIEYVDAIHVGAEDLGLGLQHWEVGFPMHESGEMLIELIKSLEPIK